MSKLDGICRRGNEKVEALNAEYDKAIAANDLDAAADVIETRTALAAPIRDEMAALVPPANDADALAGYLRSAARLDGLTGRLGRALRDEDVTEAMRIGKLIESARDARTEYATDLGLVECGS